MSFQCNQGEIDPLVGVGREIPGADDGTQVVQLTQIQIAEIVSNAVSQALTHQMQQIKKQSIISYCHKSRDTKHHCCTTVLNTHQVRYTSIRGR